MKETDVSGLLVIVAVRDVSRETEVSNLHHVVVSNQNVSCRQVTMNALHQHPTSYTASFISVSLTTTASF